MNSIVPGSLLQDNDRRFHGRRVTVTRTVLIGDQWYAIWQGVRRENKIAFRRIFMDGAKRAQGWNLVQA